MHCHYCGTQLPENAIYCPGCAKLTPYGISQSQVTPDNPTSAAPHSHYEISQTQITPASVASPAHPPPPPAILATNYGSFPYNRAQQNPYEASDPYAEPQQAPKKKGKIALIVAIILLIIIVGTSGIVLYTVAISPLTHYPFSTNLVLNDPLGTNNSANAWDITNPTNKIGSCAFANGAYEITSYRNNVFCTANAINLSNFTYEVQMTIKNGGTGALGGIIFRHTVGTAKHYVFSLAIDGSYILAVKTGVSSGNVLRFGRVTGFASGFNQLHTIAVVTRRPQISIYVDQNQILQLSDTTYASGTIGMISGYGTSNTTVAYTNAKVWQL